MKLTVQLGALAAVNIALSFVFQWYIFTHFGADVETDAFFAGTTIPQLILAVVSGSLTHVLVPILAGQTEARLQHDSWAFLSLISGFFLCLSFVLYMSAPWWVPLTVPGFTDSAQALTVTLARIQLVGVVFAGINGVQLAVFHARKTFLWAELAQLISSAFCLFLLALTLPVFGIIAAAWIAALKFALLTVLLLPGMGYPVKVKLGDPIVRTAWRRIKPLLAGTAYYKTDILIERFLLSAANPGTLSIFHFAQQLYGAANQVLNKAITVPAVPMLSQARRQNDEVAFRKLYGRKLRQMVLISLAGLFCLIFFGKPLLALLVGYGSITDENIELLWLILIWLSGVLVGGATGQIASCAFYSIGNTSTPVKMSVITYTLYIPVKITSFLVWGVAGLAVVTTVYYLINLLLLLLLFERKKAFGNLGQRRK
jgi:putative peptidoglycan lipid II flippase